MPAHRSATIGHTHHQGPRVRSTGGSFGSWSMVGMAAQCGDCQVLSSRGTALIALSQRLNVTNSLKLRPVLAVAGAGQEPRRGDGPAEANERERAHRSDLACYRSPRSSTSPRFDALTTIELDCVKMVPRIQACCRPRADRNSTLRTSDSHPVQQCIIATTRECLDQILREAASRRLISREPRHSGNLVEYRSEDCQLLRFESAVRKCPGCGHITHLSGKYAAKHESARGNTASAKPHIVFSA